MKKLYFVLMAVLFMSGVAMAQHRGGNRGDKMPDPQTRAERMTERMVKEYGLNDEQKQQLKEANLALMEKIGDMPPMGRKHHRKDAACNCDKMDKNRPDKANKDNLTDEQRAQMKAEREKKMAEMKTARQAYDAKLQQIMTKEQYASYVEKTKDKKGGKREKRR